jgi:hypothetical protein
MNYLLVRHRIADYAKWRPFFDGDIPAQKKAGLKVLYVLREDKDPNNLFILFEAEDLAKAREFTESPDLRKTMEKAGVIDMPDIHFLHT